MHQLAELLLLKLPLTPRDSHTANCLGAVPEHLGGAEWTSDIISDIISDV